MRDRLSAATGYAFIATCQGPTAEQASMAFEEEFDDVMEARAHPAIDHFEDELKRRGQDPRQVLASAD